SWGEAAGDMLVNVERMIGGTYNDQIQGGSGNDFLDGGASNDRMEGFNGDDTYVVDNVNDFINEYANYGTDTVQASVSWTLIANLENLTLTGTSAINGTGNSVDNVITGNSAANTLTGAAGNDTLDGGAGNDTLVGGTGDDTYVVDNAGDVVTENASEGTDLVKSSVTWTLSANLENLTLTGSNAIDGTGNGGSNTLTGNAAANTLDGGAGSDILDGGAGADKLIGGDGSDTYYVDDAGDVVVETGAASTPYTPPSGFTVVGTADLNGDGQTDVLLWNATTNVTQLQVVKDGVGETPIAVPYWANWTVMGLADLDADGDKDILYKYNTSNEQEAVYLNGTTVGSQAYLGVAGKTVDSIVPVNGIGKDPVVASIDYTLGANLENLTLTGTGSINGTGNTLDNVLTGNSASNTLSGGAGNDTLDGGLGADTLAGGADNDTYLVDRTDDVIVENVGEGTDLVQSAASYALSANIENLTLTGTAAINGTGNASDNTITGNSADNVLDGGAGNDKLIGGGGNDTASYATSTLGVVASLSTPASNTGDAAGDTYSSIENLTGSAAKDTLTGDGSANILIGGGGADVLDGGAGTDTASYATAGAGVTAFLGAPGSNTGDASGDTYTSIENLTGSAFNDVLYGNNVANVLNGGDGIDTADYSAATAAVWLRPIEDAACSGAEAAGDSLISIERLIGSAFNDTLYGSYKGGMSDPTDNYIDGGAGADYMAAWNGNDTYIVDNTGDVVNEYSGGGIDTVYASVTYSITIYTDNLTLTGAAAINATGNSGDNVLIGNSAANTLTGAAGNDTLDGGAGNDALVGGAGDDIYVVDNAGDVVTESTSEGTDLVRASVSYTLGSNVENLTLTGTAAINGTGNTLDNVLTGNDAANTLTGGAGNDTLNGGTGNDTLVGGAGNDTYVVDSAGDVITEGAGDVADLVQSSASNYTLGANVENLTLTGTGSISGTGNTLDNVLTGNSASNTLSGGGGNDTLDGGLGADTLAGGTGNDTYLVDRNDDLIIENAGEGTDLVQSAANYALSANIESLTLTGTAAINGTGNASDNTITGNSADNVLDGGAGNDTLIGGGGNDTYLVDNASDVVTEGAGAGTDLVRSSASHTLGVNVENLELLGTAASGTGNALANTITGNVSANTLAGGDGNDILIGGGGADVLDGGAGTDTASYATAGAGVTALLGAPGSNTGDAAGDTYTSIENLTGSAFNDVLYGNNVANVLNGGDGIDTADYSAATAAVWLRPIEDAACSGAEAAGDSLISIERLIGSAFNDTLYGSYKGGMSDPTDNYIDGGAGADYMAAWNGNDTYIVDNTGDVVNEYSGGGIDTVYASVTYSITIYTDNLTLTGAAAINATGNSGDNVLIGNSAANTLTGAAGNDTLDGGAGNDALVGGAGDDIYVVDNAGDVVTESTSEGTDLVRASVSYTLGSNVENLTLTGTAAINGTGNTLDNVLTGNDAANTLTGGAGNDTLNGGTGNDLIQGGDGVDIYRFDRGGETDTLTVYDTDGSADKLVFGANIATDQLWFRNADQDGDGTFDDLEIDVIGTTDKVYIDGWNSSSAHKLDRVTVSNGTYAAVGDIANLVSAMASFSPPPLGQTQLDPTVAQALAPTLAASWHA
ncbi:beta strand repeat-containing protein, partial [Dongia sp.]|uniref:beta strand repeat-containing protein n=1 Tax=Dongia sp. TaxID=1977262 RepID=UPI0037516CD5